MCVVGGVCVCVCVCVCVYVCVGVWCVCLCGWTGTIVQCNLSPLSPHPVIHLSAIGLIGFYTFCLTNILTMYPHSLVNHLLPAPVQLWLVVGNTFKV